jgi:ribosomal protein L18E
MNKRTKALQFSEDTMQKIIERDGDCFFCKQGYHLAAPIYSGGTALDFNQLPF